MDRAGAGRRAAMQAGGKYGSLLVFVARTSSWLLFALASLWGKGQVEKPRCIRRGNVSYPWLARSCGGAEHCDMERLRS